MSIPTWRSLVFWLLGLTLGSSYGYAICEFNGPGNYCKGQAISIAAGNITDFVLVPGSDWIIGVSDAKGQKDLVGINKTNSTFLFLTDSTSDEESPSVSPDGKFVSYISRANDPLGNVVVAKLSVGKKISLTQVDEIKLPNSQESHPTLTNNAVYFSSNMVTDNNSKIFTKTLKTREISNFSVGDTPVVSASDQVVWNQNGRLIIGKNSNLRPLFKKDGFLRRSAIFVGESTLIYLRYSADSNGDGKIDSTDDYEVVKVGIKDLGVVGEEEILKFGDLQILTLASTQGKLIVSERTKSGYQLMEYQETPRECSLASAVERDQYETFISVCSAATFGVMRSLEWRYVIRNTTLSGSPAAMTLNQNSCPHSECDFASVKARYTSELSSLLSSRSYSFPAEILVDFALRTKRLKNEDAYFLLRTVKNLSPYTLSRLIGFMSSSPSYLQYLRNLVQSTELNTAFFASLGIVSHIAEAGDSDLALNQLAFTTREFAKRGLDVSPALKKACELSSAAGLRGLMKIPLLELSTASFSAPWIKQKSYYSAKNYLVGEGNDAIAKGEQAVARSSFLSALTFDPNSLGAKKGLVQLGYPLPGHQEIDQILKKTSEININLDPSKRSSLAREILTEIRKFSGVYDHESEYFRLLGWLNFQIHLAEVANSNSVSGFFKNRMDILGGIFGFSPTNYLEESLTELRRAEKIERNFGSISPLLSQDLAIVLFEQGDFKSAFSLSLERVRSISALKFEDAEVASYFLSLASSAAGKLDEHNIAIQLAGAAEIEARKINDSALLKIKKSKVYLLFQAGRYEEAAAEASTIAAVSEEGIATRFKLLRVWFLRLAGKTSLSQKEFKSLDLTHLESLKPVLGEDVFQLAKWLQREMTSLPAEKDQILADVNQAQTQVGFFGRIVNRVLGNTDIFVSRAKLAIDSAQKLSRAGLTDDAAKVLTNSRSDLDRVASDVFNRETSLILGYWLDLSLAVSKNRQEIQSDMLRFLELAEKGCKKIDNGDRNKNCIAIKSSIESRMSLGSFSYHGGLDYHSSRPFYLSSPEKISLFLSEEGEKMEGARRWISLVAVNRIEDGLALWAKGVLSGELRGYDLDEVLSYFSRLPIASQNVLNRGIFRGAKLVRMRQALGLDSSEMLDYLAKVDFSGNKSADYSGRFNFLTHEKVSNEFFMFDVAVSDVALSESNVRLPVADTSALKWIPLQVDLAKLDSLKPLLNDLKSSGKEGVQLTVCATKTQSERPLSKGDEESLDRLYASTWDYFKGNIVISFECLDSTKSEPLSEDYFDAIDSGLSDAAYFKAWSSGLAKEADPKLRSELLDRLSKELVGRKNNTLAYQVLSVLTYLPDRDVSKSYTALATIASRLKKWDLVKRALDHLDSYYSSHEVEPALRLDLLRMKAILAESTLKKEDVISQWQRFIEASQAKLDHQAKVRGLVSLGNYLLDKVSDFSGAQKYYAEAASYAEEKKIGSFEAKFGLAMIKMRSNSFNGALSDLKQLEVDETSTGNDLITLKINQQLNSALFGLGRLSEASIRQGKTRALFAKLNSASLRSRYEILDLNLNGMILAKQGWYQLATQQFTKALSLSEESKFPELMSLVLANQGFWMRAYGFVDLSVKNYERALQLDDPLDETAIASDKRNLGLAALAAFDLASSHRYLSESESLSIRLGLDSNLALSRMGLSEILYKGQNFEEALKKINLSISYFLKDYNPEYFWRALYARSEISRKRGAIEAAQKDLDRALLVALSLPPGQRLGLGPDTTWVDVTMRDVVDRWLEYSGARDPNLAAGILGYFQFREQMDQLTSIPGASEKLSDLTIKLAKELGDGEASAKSSDDQVKTQLSSLSQSFLARLPSDTLVLWSLKVNVVALRRMEGKFAFYSIPFEKSVLSRYGDFSEKLLSFSGETEILRVNLFDELLKPVFPSELPKNISIIASKEFLPLPLELLGPEKNRYLGIETKVNWLLPKLGPDLSSRENGFWGGTVFDGLDRLELVQEGAKQFKVNMRGKVALDSKIQGEFHLLEISGHHLIGKDGLPILALGKDQNYPPLDVFGVLPASQTLFLNICGTDLGSPLLRAIASAKGSRQIIDARGAVSELSSFMVSKTLMPLVASGQKIDEALQNTRDILARQGKHPSYWARFRAWATY
ncbi:MAG: hypothetical protein WCI18_02540 [Pseudomonadota bacterium]